MNSDPLVFTGSDSLILFKCPDKVAEIVKTVPVGNFCDRIVCSGQLIAGLLDSLMVQVIHRCLMSHF